MEDIGTGPKLALEIRGMCRKKGTKSGIRSARGPGGRGTPAKGHSSSSRETPMVQPSAKLELYLRLPVLRSSTRKKYKRKSERMAFFGSGKATLVTRIFPSFVTSVLTESTRVATRYSLG